MLVIRLLRVGKRNQPSFKIVVTEKSNPPRGGRFIEEVGFYNPKTKEKILKKERIQYWLSQGVQPSATVYNLLVKEGIVEGKKIPVHKKSKKKEEKKEDTPTDKATEVKPQPSEPPKEEAKEVKPPSVPPEEKKEEKKAEPSVEEKPEEKPKEEPSKPEKGR